MTQDGQFELTDFLSKKIESKKKIFIQIFCMKKMAKKVIG